ncbi:MAG: radical SAM protein [Acidobacteria bacterium]|jgi:23S rRNA (adenine2503-C2)-methyltransferase|nr:radical SAM protein [Acidobacteriota bacterium]
MRVIASAGRDDLAQVYIARNAAGDHVEFVESLQPPLPREKKWVLIVSCLFGCPCACRFCDAGGEYHGRLSREEIEFQIDYLVRKRFPDGVIPSEKFKIQFARMGEPAMNPALLDVIAALPGRLQAPGLLLSLSTIAPCGCDSFFHRLLAVKDGFPRGTFQFQFSLHASDEQRRRELVPAPTWSFAAMAAYGRDFFRPGDRKITLNFALATGFPLRADQLLAHFDPAIFLVKITPVNPTRRALASGLLPVFVPGHGDEAVVDDLRRAGYEVIVSIGEFEENAIGSNCGQFLRSYLDRKGGPTPHESYSYPLKELPADG